VSIKQEQENHPEFSNKIYEQINGSGLWRYESQIPTLGEVRGKALLFSRYTAQYSEGSGIHASTWPDSRKEGFEWDCHGVPFRVQDW
jgi:1-phosphatidylinositol phosphodiesterase